MEQELTKMGRCLPVPCGQELAKEPLDTVPPRYVRPDQDPPIISSSSSLPKLPVIDFQSLLSDHFMDSELQKLHHTCQEWGFFQIGRGGMEGNEIDQFKSSLISQWKRSKKKFWQHPGDLEGYGQAFVVSEEQKLDWADLFYMITLPTYLRKPYLLPQFPPPFRDTLEAYSVELKALAMKILDLLAKALKLEAMDMKELFEEGWQSIRMNYYPPCSQPELVIGLNPHSDAVGLTILLQVNEIEGLQIRKNGMWIPVKPLPNAFVVNIGDILEMVTNGLYQSIEHRATVNSEKERLSMAAFYSPKLDGYMGPAPSLVTAERPALFKRIGVAEYFRGFYPAN